MTTEELKKLENDLWNTADDLRANSDLKSSEYSTPILGIIFLKFADNKYKKYENEMVENDLSFKMLSDHRERLESISLSMMDYFSLLGEKEGIDFQPVLKEISKLDKSFISFQVKSKDSEIDKANKEQRDFYTKIEPFFVSLHSLLKKLDQKIRELEKGIETETNKDKKKEWNKKNREIKTEQEKIHKEVKDMEYFFSHIRWLQDRFPQAKYEDVTGLCKSATPAEIEEQEFSLNPGRYVGVVIEEDGKTEEEFMEEIFSLNEEFKQLNTETAKLEKVIVKNVGVLGSATLTKR
ncbi:MAG: N-6 DNA methylase [Leptospiraceae bacterium]|nr:N-6 DNA methylase [Leptospiraceae bacterium]